MKLSNKAYPLECCFRESIYWFRNMDQFRHVLFWLKVISFVPHRGYHCAGYLKIRSHFGVYNLI